LSAPHRSFHSFPTRRSSDLYVSGYSTKTALSDKATQFIEAYKKKYGSEPNMFAALAYDSVYMIAEAAKGAKTSIDIADNLAKLRSEEHTSELQSRFDLVCRL